MVTGVDVCNNARKFLGYPYIYGGNSPAIGGFDCSGFAQYAYKLANINIPRTTYEQIKIGTKVTDKSKLVAGDLVFNFDSKGIPQHVMIYSGDNKVIEAQYEGTLIKEHSFWKWEGVAVRIIKEIESNIPVKQEPESPQNQIFYRVICGSYKEKKNALERQQALKAYGFNSFIAEYSESMSIVYRVVVGAYKDRVNAEAQQKILKDKGFESFLLAFKK